MIKYCQFKRNATRKDSYSRGVPAFLETTFWTWLFQMRNEIEHAFHILKDKGLENPRMFGYNRYHFHVQTLLLVHNIAFYYSFATGCVSLDNLKFYYSF
jgi:hypothetical protein